MFCTKNLNAFDVDKHAGWELKREHSVQTHNPDRLFAVCYFQWSQQQHTSENHPPARRAHNVVAGLDDSCDNLPVEKRQAGGSQPCCDAGGVIRSPSDSYSDSEIVIIAKPLSPEGANTTPVPCCTRRQPSTWRAAAWCLFHMGTGGCAASSWWL